MADKKKRKTTKNEVNIAGFFEKGFEPTDFKRIGDYPDDTCLKYMGHDIFEGRFGKTNRVYLQDSEGNEVRFLIRGKTFISALEKFCIAGKDLIRIFKNEKGYWIFDRC